MKPFHGFMLLFSECMLLDWGSPVLRLETRLFSHTPAVADINRGAVLFKRSRLPADGSVDQPDAAVPYPTSSRKLNLLLQQVAALAPVPDACSATRTFKEQPGKQKPARGSSTSRGGSEVHSARAG